MTTPSADPTPRLRDHVITIRVGTLMKTTLTTLAFVIVFFIGLAIGHSCNRHQKVIIGCGEPFGGPYQMQPDLCIRPVQGPIFGSPDLPTAKMPGTLQGINPGGVMIPAPQSGMSTQSGSSVSPLQRWQSAPKGR